MVEGIERLGTIGGEVTGCDGLREGRLGRLGEVPANQENEASVHGPDEQFALSFACL
jgi:hypothetical protein